EVLRIWHVETAGCSPGGGGGRDGIEAGGGIEPARAADHGRGLRAGGGHGGRGRGSAARPADADGGADGAGDPRAEGAPDAPAGGTEVRLPGEPAAGPRRADGAPAGAADVLRRIAGEGGRRALRRRDQRAIGGGAGSAGGPDRAGQEERGLIMLGWDDPTGMA